MSSPAPQVSLDTLLHKISTAIPTTTSPKIAHGQFCFGTMSVQVTRHAYLYYMLDLSEVKHTHVFRQSCFQGENPHFHASRAERADYHYRSMYTNDILSPMPSHSRYLGRQCYQQHTRACFDSAIPHSSSGLIRHYETISESSLYTTPLLRSFSLFVTASAWCSATSVQLLCHHKGGKGVLQNWLLRRKTFAYFFRVLQ